MSYESDYLTTPGQLFPAERQLLHDLASEVAQSFPPLITIVNIGIRQGASLHSLRAGAPLAWLVGVDWDLTSIPMVGDPGAEIIEGDSTAPEIQSLIPPPVHLLFVDGGHDDGVVTQDILWTSKIPPGGIVAFHDYYERRLKSGLGVRVAVDRWMASDGWDGQWQHHRSCKLTVAFRRI